MLPKQSENILLIQIKLFQQASFIRDICQIQLTNINKGLKHGVYIYFYIYTRKLSIYLLYIENLTKNQSQYCKTKHNRFTVLQNIFSTTANAKIRIWP